MLGIEKEMGIFLSACLTGIFVCSIYLAIRVIRRIMRHSLFWISLEDFLFWVGTGVYLFVEIFRTCSGSIRWYYVLGVILGGLFTIELAKIKKLLRKGKKQDKMKLTEIHKKR